MRCMIMHKTNAFWEAGAKPTPEEIQLVGRMIGELQRSGAMLGGEGLAASSQGARVRVTGGERTIVPGPFGGEGALPARYAIFRATSVDEAAEISARFGRIFGDVVVDVRPVNEAWDLGMAPKPDGLSTRRYMAVVNADAASEAGTPLTREQRASLKTFSDDLARTGALLAVGHLEPSAKGKRLRKAAAKRIVLDGPFSETKELIGGFVIVEVPSIEDAVRWAHRYVEAVDVEEVDVRGMASEQQ